MYRLAIYGKGGIGKSTTTGNISAALAAAGMTVMQVGCDPKSDSTKLPMGGRSIPTVLDRMREGSDVRLDDIVFRSESGILCVEAGGPVPGVGCAGRGIIAAFDKLEELGAFEELKPDVVLYDVLGDVVCGGFAMPLRGSYSDGVMVVTSGEMMSLYAASNIIGAVRGFANRGYASFEGIIANLRNIEDEEARIDTFCNDHDTTVLGTISRSPIVQSAEDAGKTVIEAFPDSDIAESYRKLASIVASLAAS